MENNSWKIEWVCENIHEMDCDIDAYKYSQSVCKVSCPFCKTTVGQKDWTALSKASSRVLTGQTLWLKSLQTPYCPYCGKSMKEG